MGEVDFKCLVGLHFGFRGCFFCAIENGAQDVPILERGSDGRSKLRYGVILHRSFGGDSIFFHVMEDVGQGTILNNNVARCLHAKRKCLGIGVIFVNFRFNVFFFF